MTRQAFRLTSGLNKGAIVEITSCEDRGGFFYASYRPVLWLDGERVPGATDLGSFGAIRVKKDLSNAPVRLPIIVRDCPQYGIGQRGGFTMQAAAA